jgi:hypothetical protein
MYPYNAFLRKNALTRFLIRFFRPGQCLVNASSFFLLLFSVRYQIHVRIIKFESFISACVLRYEFPKL